MHVLSGAATAAVGAPKQKAACSVSIGCGTLSFYEQTAFSDARYEAVCHIPEHNENGLRCRWTRGPGQRPCGAQGMWLGDGDRHATHAEHNDDLVRYSYLQEDRQQWRDAIKSETNGPRLLSHERQLAPGEPEEPAD